MLSGSNLLRYRDRYTTPGFLRKRLKKIIPALLFGSVVCCLLYGSAPTEFWGAVEYGEGFGVEDFVKRLLRNEINSTYWFLYAIIYLYLLTPILSLMVDRPRLLGGLLLATFFVAFLLPSLVWGGLVRKEYVDTLFSWPMYGSVTTYYYVLTAFPFP